MSIQTPTISSPSIISPGIFLSPTIRPVRRRQSSDVRNPRNYRLDYRRSKCQDIRTQTPPPSAMRNKTSMVAKAWIAQSNDSPTKAIDGKPHASPTLQTSPCQPARSRRRSARRTRPIVEQRKPAENELGDKEISSARQQQDGNQARYPQRPLSAEVRPAKVEDISLDLPQRRPIEDAATQGRHTTLSRDQTANSRPSGPAGHEPARRSKDGIYTGRHYGAQPRRPKESAPASSHPSALDELDLPFQVGHVLSDPISRIRYTITQLLGRGAYALVWQARRSTDNKTVALKALSTRLLTPAQRELQLMEIEFHTRAYARAPQAVAPIYASWKQPDDDWHWICMGHCSNGDLYTWLTEGSGSSGHLPPQCPLRSKYWTEILTAVNSVHELGIGHRDLKPENFLISTKNSIVLTDFGLATADEVTTDWECGSRPYMAPEIRNLTEMGKAPRPYAPRVSDIWSLGVIYLNLHHLCPAWSSPDVSCANFRHFCEHPDTWLEDAGVVDKPVREWLMTKVFVRPELRCTVAEWLEWEKARKPPVRTPRPSMLVSKPELLASPSPVARASGLVQRSVDGSAVVDPPATMAKLNVATCTPGAQTPRQLFPPKSAPPAASATKRRHARHPSWAFDLDFDSEQGGMDYSKLPTFGIVTDTDEEEGKEIAEGDSVQTPKQGATAVGEADPFVVSHKSG